MNALGVVHSVTAFLPLLRASSATLKKIAVVGTAGADPKSVRMAGIADMAAYGTTKAAALMITTKLALKLKDENFVVISMSPGIVDTTDTMGESGQHCFLEHRDVHSMADRASALQATHRLRRC